MPGHQRNSSLSRREIGTELTLPSEHRYAVRSDVCDVGPPLFAGRLILASIDMREYAKRGAAARLEELERERQEILRAFPDLRSTRAGVRSAATRVRKVRRRRKLSADARRRISEAQKRRWAAQKAKQ
jgi:hypothetical protein